MQTAFRCFGKSLRQNLPDGYLTLAPKQTYFGESVLQPTIIYSRLIEALLGAGVPIHYAVNITGHGWCKLMRAKQPFEYIINKLAPPTIAF